MDTPKIEVTMHGQGAILEGKDRAIVERFLRDAQEAVAQQGLANVQRFLDASIRHPTPYYETQITMQRVQSDIVVHDRGIIYGPWLEGTAPANRKSSFKGYHSFRKARQQTESEVPRIVLSVLRRYLGRL